MSEKRVSTDAESAYDESTSPSAAPLATWRKSEASEEPQRPSSARERFITIQCVLLNTFSTVAIVFLNKIVFSDSQLGKCQISIAAWHFTLTAIVLYLATCSPIRAFPAIRLPVLQVLPISAFFSAFLILGNLSLTFNTVGFYQLTKIMTTPTVVLLNFILFQQAISRPTFISIFVTCCGVGLVTSTSLLSNPLGTFIAVSAFTVTALYQIWIGKKIADLNVSPPQLLLNQAPVSVGLLLVMMPFIDTIPDVSLIPSHVLYTLFASGLLASALNLSQFLIIGRTSALTFNVVSQVKTVVIVGLSWYSEGRSLTLIDVCGVTMALGGAYAYAQFSQKA